MTNRIHDAFDQIHASSELKSSVMHAMQLERERRMVSVITRRKALLVLCSIFVLVIGALGYDMVQTPVSYVSIDVNPSIELALNRLDRVVSATAYNEDGNVLLKDISVNGKPYKAAIDLIVESKPMQPYLSGNAVLSFTIASASQEKEAALLKGIESCAGCKNHGGESYRADIGAVDEAHQKGLSLGKYAAYLTLVQYDDTVTTQDCQSMSMSEIHDRIQAHQNDGEHESGNGLMDSCEPEATHQQHGNGHQSS